MSFDTLGLSPTLLQAVIDTGYTTPTPIQLRAIPAILTGQDVMAAAQTGTGKTAGFTLPLLQRLAAKPASRNQFVRALVLTPTRELAAQVQESVATYGKHEKLRTTVVFGGVGINPQIDALRKGCDILVATPGRLLDLHQQHAVAFDHLEILVLDEADRMLDMGFIHDIKRILKLLPKQRQNLLFSATFSDEIRALAKSLCKNPLEIDVAPRNSTVDSVTQQVYEVGKDKKLALLGKLLQETRDQVLVFSRTKHGANNLVKKLAGFGVEAAAIHGNKSQSQRIKALGDFKNNKTQVLVATDIAARGIDIEQLAMVINFDLPQVAEDYVHRIGRTGRAGATGLAVSLVCEDDRDMLKSIERLIKRRIDRMSFDSATLPVPKAAPVQAAPPAHKPAQQKAAPQRSSQHNSRKPQGARSGQSPNNSSRSNNAARPARQHASSQQQPAWRSDAKAPAGQHPQRRGGHSNKGKQRPAQDKPVSGNREGASFAPRAEANGGKFWQNLGKKLFNR